MLAVAAVYHAAPSHEFINYDDTQYVTRSAVTQQGITADGIAWAFRDVSTGNWHPLSRLSHMLDCELFGINAGAHHAVNVAFHAANSVLLLLALTRLTGAFWRSALVAGLFALHPLHVESVAWVSERKDVLSGFFWIAAMYAYAVYAERVSLARYLPVALLFVLGLMAKPMLITLPAALLLLDIWPLTRLSAPIGVSAGFAKCIGLLILEKLPLFALGIGTAILTLGLQEHALHQAEELTNVLRVQNAFAAYGVYLKQTFWPSGLAIFYPHPLTSLSTAAWVSGAAAVALGSVAACATIKRAPYMFVGWWWFVGTLVPVIGIIQVGLQGWADRYTYLPHIGLFLTVVWWLNDVRLTLFKADRIPRLLRVSGVGASAAILVALGVASARQHSYWKDTVTVFERALAVTENNKLAHLILGTEHAKRGDQEAAERHFYAAIQIEGDTAWTENMPEGHFALGILAERQGDWSEAAEQYAKAIELDEQFSEAHNNLAGVYMEFGRTADDYLVRARVHAERALELKPDNAHAAANAAFLALHFQDYDAAVRLHELALPHFPDQAAMHRNMGLALFGAGDARRAIEFAENALAIDPGFVEARGDLARYRAALE